MFQKFIHFYQNIFESIHVGFFLAFRQIRRSSKWTTGLIIFIMVLTFLNLVVVSGLLIGLISGSFKQFRESYSGEVIITSTPGKNYIENSPALVSYLESHPKVSGISHRYGKNVQVLGTLNDLPKKDERANKIGIRMVGIDIKDEEYVTHFSRFIKYGQNLDPNEEGYALIGANMIKKYSTFADANIPGLDLLTNINIGNRIRVSFTREDGSLIQKEFIIKGIIKSKVDEISTRLFIPENEFKRLLSVNHEQYQEIAIKTDIKYAATLVQELKNFNTGFDARIQTTDEAIPSFLRQIEQTFSILGNALSSVAVIVASITIFIVIFINAVTRRKFIGIMKGIGISPRAIIFSYMFQAFFYAVIGSLIGIILTFGFLKPYFDAHPIDFPFSDGILVVTIQGAAIRVAILFVVTMLAGYIPSKLIVRKNTLDSILGR
jgi:putative ABC transport system permease protein